MSLLVALEVMCIDLCGLCPGNRTTAHVADFVSGGDIQFQAEHTSPLDVANCQHVERQLLGLEVRLHQGLHRNPRLKLLDAQREIER